MIRRLVSFAALACLLAPPAAGGAVPGGSAAAPGTPVASPRALLERVEARYAALGPHRFAGRTHMEIAGGQLPQPMTLDMDFVYAEARPGRMRVQMSSPGLSSLIVADGDTLRAWAEQVQQYIVRPVPHTGRLAEAVAELGGALEPLAPFVHITKGLEEVTELDADTIVTVSGPVPCRVLRMILAPDTTQRDVKVAPRVLWIDAERALVLRDSLALETNLPGGGAMRRTQQMRFTDLDDASAGPDSLYAFRLPAPAERVAAFHAPGQPEPPSSALLGKPAPDFTLPALKGAAVTLSKLRGRVVVLDFWATWCGPCRRWMPIVAQVEREYAAGGTRFFAVNVREDAAKVRGFTSTLGTTPPPILLDATGKTADAYGAMSIPLTVIVAPDGKVARTLLGLHTADELRAALKEAGAKVR